MKTNFKKKDNLFPVWYYRYIIELIHTYIYYDYQIVSYVKQSNSYTLYCVINYVFFYQLFILTQRTQSFIWVIFITLGPSQSSVIIVCKKLCLFLWTFYFISTGPNLHLSYCHHFGSVIGHCCLSTSSSINFYILIFVYVASSPISEIHIKKEAQRGQLGCCHIYEVEVTK